ncbi:hypothetical protein ACCO45_007272 [Purpureocillium lilacinum]|uniref:Uncharacterized protein n=1 Tax=Purpureocillium lilacinum TaxID=33203 RepID=A0ACC4DRW9_PURLI
MDYAADNGLADLQQHDTQPAARSFAAPPDRAPRSSPRPTPANSCQDLRCAAVTLCLAAVQAPRPPTFPTCSFPSPQHLARPRITHHAKRSLGSAPSAATMIVSTPDLAVAKAALTAALLRDDPTPVPRGAVEDGIDLIDRTLDKCSHENVQECKNWIAANIVHSHGRTTTFGKFMVALSESMEDDFDRPSVRETKTPRAVHHQRRVAPRCRPPGQRRVRRPLGSPATRYGHGRLFLRQEPEAHCKERLSASPPTSTLAIPSSPRTKKLRTPSPRPAKSLISTATRRFPGTNNPPGAGFPHLKRGSATPIRPDQIRPLTIYPGPNDEELDRLVDETIREVEDIYRPKPLAEIAGCDINALGQIIKPDRPAEKQTNYYGWSAEFCAWMKERFEPRKGSPGARASRSRSRDAYSSSPRSISPSRSLRDEADLTDVARTVDLVRGPARRSQRLDDPRAATSPDGISGDLAAAASPGWNPNQPGMQPFPPAGGPWGPGAHPPHGPAPPQFNGYQQNNWGRGGGRGGGSGGRGFRGRGRGGYNKYRPRYRR